VDPTENAHINVITGAEHEDVFRLEIPKQNRHHEMDLEVQYKETNCNQVLQTSQPNHLETMSVSGNIISNQLYL
jgi:hypothetical protein